MKKQVLVLLLVEFCVSLQAQFSKPRRAYVEYLVTTNHANRTYDIGEQASISIEAYKGGMPLDGVTVYYKVGDEMFLPTNDDSTMFKNGVATIPFGTMHAPGFRACSLRFTVYGKTYSDMVKVGFIPQDIMPLTNMPKDFDKFWMNTLKETEKVGLQPEIIPLPKYSTDKVDVSLVKLVVGKNGRNMYGYLTRPNDGKKHPVLFCPPGAGANKITPTTYYSDRGYIYMNINIHNGCNPELSDSVYAELCKPVDGYNRQGIEKKETFYYREVYAGCSRCVDFLCTLPDWDGHNVGVTGGSQGGALTIVTSALNRRVTFCAPFYPALCDLLGFKNNRAGGWPKYYRNYEENIGAEQTLPYYDVVNFARRLKCPVFYSFGYNDDTCSPTSTFAAFNVITAPNTLVTTPTSGHWRFPETNDECMAWMAGQCKGTGEP